MTEIEKQQVFYLLLILLILIIYVLISINILLNNLYK
jgi:hypothetical protein